MRDHSHPADYNKPHSIPSTYLSYLLQQEPNPIKKFYIYLDYNCYKLKCKLTKNPTIERVEYAYRTLRTQNSVTRRREHSGLETRL